MLIMIPCRILPMIKPAQTCHECSLELTDENVDGLCPVCLLRTSLSNDYGDSIHGADHVGRVGPDRAVQSGAISRKTMKLAIIVLTILSLVSGIYLLYTALGFGTQSFLFFFLLGFGFVDVLPLPALPAPVPVR